MTINDQVNRLVHGKIKDLRKLSDQTRASMVNVNFVGSNKKTDILNFIVQRIPQPEAIFCVRRLDWQAIKEYPNWVILEWYFSASNIVEDRILLAHNLEDIKREHEECGDEISVYKDALDIVKDY